VLRAVYDSMVAHALEERPHECCGMLAGKEGVITRLFRATNIAENKSVRYEVDGAEVIRILHEIRRCEDGPSRDLPFSSALRGVSFGNRSAPGGVRRGVLRGWTRRWEMLRKPGRSAFTKPTWMPNRR